MVGMMGVQSTPANNWSRGKQSKMRMQTMLAATNRRHPDYGFTAHWKEPEEFRVPVDHAAFDDIATFTRDFPALIAA
jgi:hypothetical protein